MKGIQVYCRVSLLVFFAAAWWMSDCAGELTVARSLKEKNRGGLAPELQRALHGCGSPEVAAELTTSFHEFVLLLPTEADRAEVRFALRRDYIFIAAYALAYLGLARVLYYRVGRFGAIAASILTLMTVGCDLGENYHTFDLLQRLQGDYRLDSPEGKSVAFANLEATEQEMAPTMKIKSWCSKGKWIFLSALHVAVAFVFLGTRRFWPDLAGLLFALAGIIGVIGFAIPALIQWAVLLASFGALLGTCILLGPAYWERMAALPRDDISQKPQDSGGFAYA